MKQRLHPVEILLMLTAALLLTSGAVALQTQSEYGSMCWQIPTLRRIRP